MNLASTNPPGPPDLRIITSEPTFDAVPPAAEAPVAIASPKPDREGLVIFGIVVVGLLLLANHKPVEIFHAVDEDDDEAEDEDEDEEEDALDEPVPAPEPVAAKE